MGKSKHNTPKFLLSTLSDNTKARVRTEWKLFLAEVKARDGKSPQMSHDLLDEFVKHLGKVDTKFKKIHSSALKTTHVGTLFIYDYMRKHLSPSEEKPATPAPPRTRATPPKEKPAATSTPIPDDPPV